MIRTLLSSILFVIALSNQLHTHSMNDTSLFKTAFGTSYPNLYQIVTHIDPNTKEGLVKEPIYLRTDQSGSKLNWKIEFIINPFEEVPLDAYYSGLKLSEFKRIGTLEDYIYKAMVEKLIKPSENEQSEFKMYKDLINDLKNLSSSTGALISNSSFDWFSENSTFLKEVMLSGKAHYTKQCNTQYEQNKVLYEYMSNNENAEPFHFIFYFDCASLQSNKEIKKLNLTSTPEIAHILTNIKPDVSQENRRFVGTLRTWFTPYKKEKLNAHSIGQDMIEWFNNLFLSFDTELNTKIERLLIHQNKTPQNGMYR